jgi:hypothetical protein
MEAKLFLDCAILHSSWIAEGSHKNPRKGNTDLAKMHVRRDRGRQTRWWVMVRIEIGRCDHGALGWLCHCRFGYLASQGVPGQGCFCGGVLGSSWVWCWLRGVASEWDRAAWGLNLV